MSSIYTRTGCADETALQLCPGSACSLFIDFAEEILAKKEIVTAFTLSVRETN